jgi:hypothetical protein
MIVFEQGVLQNNFEVYRIPALKLGKSLYATVHNKNINIISANLYFSILYFLKEKFSLVKLSWRLFMCLVGSLFHYAFPVTRLYSVDDRVMRMVTNWKGFCMKRSWSILRYYSDIRLEGMRKTAKHFNQDSRSPGPRFESGASRIRSRSVTTRPRGSVIYCMYVIYTPGYMYLLCVPLSNLKEMTDFHENKSWTFAVKGNTNRVYFSPL